MPLLRLCLGNGAHGSRFLITWREQRADKFSCHNLLTGEGEKITGLIIKLWLTASLFSFMLTKLPIRCAAPFLPTETIGWTPAPHDQNHWVWIDLFALLQLFESVYLKSFRLHSWPHRPLAFESKPAGLFTQRKREKLVPNSKDFRKKCARLTLERHSSRKTKSLLGSNLLRGTSMH